MMEAIQEGKDVDDAIREIDVAEMEQSEKDQALADFRQEISVLKQLRHPNIVLLLAYSTTENYECLISELMKCSLLDVFKSHMVQGTRMKHKTQIVYATQLSRGMTYLHSCKPPIIHRDLVSEQVRAVSFFCTCLLCWPYFLTQHAFSSLVHFLFARNRPTC